MPPSRRATSFRVRVAGLTVGDPERPPLKQDVHEPVAPLDALRSTPHRGCREPGRILPAACPRPLRLARVLFLPCRRCNPRRGARGLTRAGDPRIWLALGASAVHHASNPEYLDANFGGVLIVFDRWFGSFREECAAVPLRYGLVEPMRSYNPLFIALHEWIAIVRDVSSSRSPRALFQNTWGPPRASPLLPHRAVARGAE